MSQTVTAAQAVIFSNETAERKHQRRVQACWIAAFAFVGVFAAYGYRGASTSRLTLSSNPPGVANKSPVITSAFWRSRS